MKLPNGPQTPLWLETLQFVLRPIEYLEARQKRYGDAFTIGSNTDSPVVYLSHPQAIEEIFTADRNLFDSGRGNKPLAQPLLGEYSLALLDGEPHQRQRRLLIPPFHGQRMKAYSQLISDITAQAIRQLPIGKAFLVRPLIEEISLRAILQAVFGLHQGDRYDLLRQLLISFLESIGSPLTASMLFFPFLRLNLGAVSPWGKFVQLRQQIDRLLYSEIQLRRQLIEEDHLSNTINERNDILSLLLMARDETGQPMTDDELRDELITLLIAGHDTTTTAITWALYWIHYLPEVHSKLLAEIDTVNIDTDRSSIVRLPYLTAVCQETLRIYPVLLAPSNRILKAPLQIMEYQFNPGTVLIPCIYLTHHREDLYPQSKHFIPERFLEKQFSPYEYFPFGGGNRGCIGMAFAMFEIKLILAEILRTNNLALKDPKSLKPIRRGLTQAPPASLELVVTSKRESQKAIATL
ncbi:cytochrome P450 [Aerosakkonema sp. BLCC-F183]|uniref:cytochrome P450 n=1 Tax=Aerosakkonema sp. BLCC-F183 TaxID=3342834 RepID=UPI0035B794EA